MLTIEGGFKKLLIALVLLCFAVSFFIILFGLFILRNKTTFLYFKRNFYDIESIEESCHHKGAHKS